MIIDRLHCRGRISSVRSGIYTLCAMKSACTGKLRHSPIDALMPYLGGTFSF